MKTEETEKDIVKTLRTEFSFLQKISSILSYSLITLIILRIYSYLPYLYVITVMLVIQHLLRIVPLSKWVINLNIVMLWRAIKYSTNEVKILTWFISFSLLLIYFISFQLSWITVIISRWLISELYWNKQNEFRWFWAHKSGLV